MADITTTIELKEGLFYRLIKLKPFILLLKLLPYEWGKWMVIKSLQYKAGKKDKWHRFNMTLVKE